MKKDVTITVNKRGRPCDYRADYHPDITFRLCSLGLTDADLAFAFDVSEVTINNWKKYKAFASSLKRGKMVADSTVAQSLYRRAVGYERHEKSQIEVMAGEGVREMRNVETIKYFPPDVQACEIWLRNRTNIFNKGKQSPETAQLNKA